MKVLVLSASLLVTNAAQALDPVCEVFIDAADKTAAQPARHSVTESDGLRMEAITVGGKSYTRIDGSPWKDMKTDLLAAEKKLNAEVRSGKTALSNCKELAAEKIDGVSMRVVSYTMSMFGMPPGESKAYIGKDGLIYGLSADDTRVRYRYTGVTAPK
jgi:hypothetical protein